MTTFAGVTRRAAVRTVLLAVTLTATAFVWSARETKAQTSNPAPPVRVISLVPAVTEMVFAIGAGDRVVGVSSFDTFPPEVASRPKVGALVDPDFERILTLRPDLVIIYGSQTDLMARLTRASIPYFNYRHSGLSGVTATIRELGVRLGRSGDGERVAGGIERGLADIRSKVGQARRPRTALLFGREPGALRGIYASGGVGFLHDLLDVAGGNNAFSEVKRESLQVSSEVMLGKAPDVILEVRSSEGWTADRLARERSLWRSLSSVPAVRSNRIYILTDSSLAVPGPRVVATAQAFFDVLHGGKR